MARPIPIYRDHDEKYRADSCRPLLDAVQQGTLRLQAVRHGHYPGHALRSAELAGVKMVGYWDAEKDQDWGLGWHRNEGIEFTFLERGHLRFAAGDRVWDLRPDDITITRPWQLHRVGDPAISSSRLIWLILDLGVRRPDQTWRWPDWVMLEKSDLDSLTGLLRYNEQPVWHSTSDIRRCFQAIARAVDETCSAGTTSRLVLRLNDLLLLITDLLRDSRPHLDKSLSSTRRTVELFLDDLRQHPEHLALDWSIEEMAHACGLRLTRFAEHVRALTNLSPGQFVTRHRLEHAAGLLLREPHLPITDIALNVGFSSSQYFATVFSSQYGCPPRNYRGMQRLSNHPGATEPARRGRDNSGAHRNSLRNSQ
jgi:AraC family L-rhamnose operon regulatory protein RhaS